LRCCLKLRMRSQTGIESNARGRDRLEKTSLDGRMSLGGKRRELRARVQGLLEVANAQMVESFATRQYVQEFCATLKKGARILDRTCIAAIMQIMSGVDAERKQLLEFIRSLGASGEQELRQKIQAYNDAGEADTLTAIERMTTALEAMLPLHEGHRAVVIRRLGGYLPVTSDRLESE